MDTVKDRNTIADYLHTVAAIAVLLALYLGWRSFLGHEGIASLLQRLF
jgi:hypothetical protein